VQGAGSVVVDANGSITGRYNFFIGAAPPPLAAF